jgi:tetratricopeptide (TPR) repeat protein
MQAAAIEFRKAVTAFQTRDYEQAKKLCTRLLKRKQLQGDAAHLLALTFKLEGQIESSKQYFERSLAAEPRNAVVLSNYANLLVQDGKFAEAEKMYRRSTTLDPSQVDAWYNLASLLNSQKQYASAADCIAKATSLGATDARHYIVLGIALRGMEDYQASVDAFDKAISLTAENTPLFMAATQNKAITYRVANEPGKAAECLAGLLQRNISSPEVHFIKACAHYDAGEYALTESGLRTAIEANPAYVDAHEALNKLYWERGDDEEFLTSYVESMSRAPQSKELRYSFAGQLILAGRSTEAQSVLAQAVADFGPQADLLHAIGVLEMRDGRFDEALAKFSQAVSMQPNATRFRIDRANILVRQQDFQAALVELEHAGAQNPLDQEVWAYRGLIWRLMGDERAKWLDDYDRLVDARFLETPEGYDNLEHFLHELRSALVALHKTNRQPLDQSVRNGTQTVGTLLSLQSKTIQDYKKALSKSIQDYIERLPADPDHPFLNRNNREFVHSGSWSIRLSSGGFHVNHMHPQGWLSNCTYVSVPGEIREDDPDRGGWIRFGETSLGLGNLEKIGKAVCPQEGMRVLFPSFMWHGTFPFESAEDRITLPSDIMPRP